jgi:prolyl 4-hydroxylase
MQSDVKLRSDFDLSLCRIWTIPGALDAARCATYITEGAGGVWRASGVKQGAAPSRTIQDIQIDAATLFDAVRSHLPETIEGLILSRIPSERVLLLRYAPGDRFMLHRDAPYVPNDRPRSLLSLMVYLNGGYAGGETVFPDDDVVIRPQAGMALAFRHDVRHEGLEVVSGEKYALHTFVMYERG